MRYFISNDENEKRAYFTCYKLTHARERKHNSTVPLTRAVCFTKEQLFHIQLVRDDTKSWRQEQELSTEMTPNNVLRQR